MKISRKTMELKMKYVTELLRANPEFSVAGLQANLKRRFGHRMGLPTLHRVAYRAYRDMAIAAQRSRAMAAIARG